MKTFNTDKILETKIRIYNTYHLKRLKEYYDNHKKEYPTRNDFLVSLIMEGLDNYEKYDKDKNYLLNQSQTLHERIDEMTNSINKIRDALIDFDQDNFINLQENQLLLLRLYHAYFQVHQELDKRFYDAGMYDNLPESFEEFKDVIETKYFCKRRKKDKQKSQENKEN